jgi:predicted phosphodiesterase
VGIAVISDLHLGARPATDLFGHDDGDFLRFLSFLERNFERIVLLGDIWETLTSSTPRGHAEELRLARDRHPELAKRFERRMYHYVHGNHDWVAADEGAPGELRWNYGGQRLIFAHGHQSDSLVMKARAVAEAGIWLGGWIRRAGMKAAYDFFDRLDQSRGVYHDLESPGAVEAWAVAEVKRREADVIVTGHTHVMRKTEHDAHLFMNSGSCAEGNIRFLALEPERGHYATHDSY